MRGRGGQDVMHQVTLTVFFFKPDLTEKSMIIVILNSQSVNLQFSKTQN